MKFGETDTQGIKILGYFWSTKHGIKATKFYLKFVVMRHNLNLVEPVQLFTVASGLAT